MAHDLGAHISEHCEVCDAFTQGFFKGKNDGFLEGIMRGRKEGYSEGKEVGYDEGFDAGQRFERVRSTRLVSWG